MKEIEISGFKDEPSKGQVFITAKPVFINAGGSSLRPGISMFALFIGDDLPPAPDAKSLLAFGGNDYTIRPGETFFPIQPFQYAIPAAAAKAVMTGKARVFVYGRAEYIDAAERTGQFCFAYQVQIIEGAARAFASRGGPSYHCTG